MNKKLTLPAFALALSVVASGCELGVTNPNQPDRARALASPDDVETLISSAYAAYWGVAHYWRSNHLASDVMSNHHSASWGNFGMNDLGREPRESLPNQVSYSYAYVFEVPWQDNYQAIAAATDGIRALDAGLEIGAGGARNARARAFAKFMQGLSSCNLALWFDQAFIIDETVDLSTGVPAAVPFGQMMADALSKLSEAEQLARGNSFTLDEGWMNGNALTNTQFADLIVSYRARCRANVPRQPSEVSGVDWATARTEATSGLRNLVIEGNEAGVDPWWDGIKSLGTENSTWHRAHMDWVGQSDVSGNYQAWLAIPLAQRQPFPLSGPDARMPTGTNNGDTGLYMRYNSACCPFRPERGTYRQSHYGDYRHDAYLNSCSFCYFGPITEMIPAEMDLIAAEAELELGNDGAAATLINLTRVGNGNLPAVTGAGTVPGGADCVPRKRFDPTGSCGDLRDALQYEHLMEVFQLSGGLTYFFMRRQGELPSGTALQWPIPASDLEVLQLDVYTFGGQPGQPGSAPSIVPGSLPSALERASWTLEMVERRQQEKLQAMQTDLRVR